jgi:enoyl-CoA hydratase/carnithine racemase
MSELVRREDRDGVCTLRLCRPERRNALSNALIEAILEGLAGAAADPTVRVVVLVGEGAAFCAGGDLADGMGAADGALAAHRGRARFAELLRAVVDHRVPVVAAVHGDALGGGFGLAMAADLVVVDPEARLGTPEVKVGLFPHIILPILMRVVPRRALMEMVYTGERVSGTRAVELGFATRVSAPGASYDEAMALAATIASRSPTAVALGKQTARFVEDADLTTALAHLPHVLGLNLATEDAAEGIAAFLQKRAPRFPGR